MMMAPLVRRTLAPAGQTPVLRQRASHRDRVSLAAALSISPVRQQIGLHFRTYPKQYVNNERAAEFLCGVLRQLRGPVIVVWDRGNMHRGDPIRELQRRIPRLELEQFPPYAPELNPVEQLWDHLKYQKFCNYAPRDVPELDVNVIRHLRRVRKAPDRLRSFLAASNLPFP
jgi:transposase